MLEFFHGWRRKAGCVSLVMASLFTIGWIRSYSIREEIVVTTFGRLHARMSASGSFSWVAWSDERIPKSFEWEMNAYWPAFQRFEYCRSFGMLGKMRNAQWSDEVWDATADKSSLWIIRYWIVTAPLILLSAYLLLWKPRPKWEPKPDA